MTRWSHRLATSVLTAALAVGCTHSDPYPPALPAPSTRVVIPWENTEPFIPSTPPPRELRWSAPAPRMTPAQAMAPQHEELAQWRPYVPPERVCTGKKTARRCTLVQPSVMDQANRTAVVKPTTVHTAYGQSIQVRYPYDGQGQKVYEILTSPGEFTRLIFPVEERLAAKLALDPQAWEVTYGKTGAEGARQELVAVRPLQAPQKGRDMLLFQSGLTIYLQLQAQDRPGMLSVVWDMPAALAPRVPTLSLEHTPPQFESRDAYSGYVIHVEGVQDVLPPWLPKVVLDDGKNTLIQLGSSLEGQRMPSVMGIQQNGKPTIVASRLYVHTGQAHPTAWVYIQGLHPAFRLKDAAGLSVLITRQVPQSGTEGAAHAQR